MGFALLTLGLGMLFAGISETRLLLDGSPLYRSPTTAPFFYLGCLASIAVIVLGFFTIGWPWVFGILIAWLPLNYIIGKVFSQSAGARLFGSHLAIAFGAGLSGYVLAM